MDKDLTTLRNYINAVKLMRVQSSEHKDKWLDKVDLLALDVIDEVEAGVYSYNFVMMCLEGGMDNVL